MRLAIFRITLLVLLVWAGKVNAQGSKVEVLHMQGEVFKMPSNTLLELGEEIQETQKLRFATPSAKVMIVNDEGVRAVLTPQQGKEGDSEFVQIVKELMPDKVNISLSSRAADAVSEVRSFTDFFGEGTFMVLGDTLQMQLAPDVYPEEQHKVYVFRYEIDGKPVQKILPLQNNQLTLVRQVLFPSGKTYPAEVYYTNRVTKYSIKYASANLLFVSPGKLQKELEMLRGYYEKEGKEMTAKELKNEFLLFVYQAYGQTDWKVMEDWLTKSFDLQG
ncbi:hypothetical protein [Algivirga pacifica]|uniref:DUF4468 domain-containing protein n=1 Tax=Algivirga pacifica TaxID=1162670 RepID=A0ABP9DG16_9BACT